MTSFRKSAFELGADLALSDRRERRTHESLHSQPPMEKEHSQSLMEPTITRVTSGGTSDPDAPQTHQEGRQEASQGEAPGMEEQGEPVQVPGDKHLHPASCTPCPPGKLRGRKKRNTEKRKRKRRE